MDLTLMRIAVAEVKIEQLTARAKACRMFGPETHWTRKAIVADEEREAVEMYMAKHMHKFLTFSGDIRPNIRAKYQAKINEVLRGRKLEGP